jgi:predicted RNase H-like nuclease (RuvC/YqgF family)
LETRCGKLDVEALERLTACPECEEDNKRCRRQVDFMATMLSRQTHRPVGAILEEWEAELTPSRELFDKVLELRAALVETEDRSRAAQEETDARSWRMVREMDLELEAERQKIAILEPENIDLKARVAELESWKMATLASRDEDEARSWRMFRDMDRELEAERQKIVDLKARVAELENWRTVTVTGFVGPLT